MDKATDKPIKRQYGTMIYATVLLFSLLFSPIQVDGKESKTPAKTKKISTNNNIKQQTICPNALEEPQKKPYIDEFISIIRDNKKQYKVNLFPPYLRAALKKHKDQSRKSITNIPIFSYILYRDWYKLIMKIVYNASIEHGSWGLGQSMSYLSRREFDHKTGEARENKKPKRQNASYGVPKVTNLPNLTNHLFDAFSNTDSRIRASALSILEKIGPHPSFQKKVLKALDRETIGQNFHDKIQSDFISGPEKAYIISLSGCTELRAPFYDLLGFHQKIMRTRLVYALERTQELSPHDMATMPSPSVYALVGEKANPFADKPDKEQAMHYYADRKALLPELRRINLIPLNDDNVPEINGALRRKKIKENFIDITSLRWSVHIQAKGALNQDLKKHALSQKKFVRIVRVILGGLDNPDLGVQARCAAFLKNVYQKSHTSLPKALKDEIISRVTKRGLLRDRIHKHEDSKATVKNIRVKTPSGSYLSQY